MEQTSAGSPGERRCQQELIAENEFLRQQVIVLKRQSSRRPVITQQDRRLLVLLASKLRGRKNALHIVKPATLLQWHRQGLRLFWKRKSQANLASRDSGRNPSP